MEDIHRDILRKRRDALLRDIEPLKLLNSLDVLDDDDREEVKMQKTRTERAETLLDMLTRKGPDAFQNFVAALSRSQRFLADVLIQDSGIDVSTFSTDDIGMTSEHKDILRRNAEKLYPMDPKELLPYLSSLLDERDKQVLQDDKKIKSQKVDLLMTEILPRKGPKAFECFVQALERVNPSVAKQLLKESGMKGSSNGKESPTPFGSVQETFSLDSPVQDILDDKPEVFKGFKENMDTDDLFGNGWKRFYKELGLPDGKEAAMERNGESPTLNVIKGWICINGRNATLQVLLGAVNRSERKDCSYYLEKSLGIQLDCVDSPINNITKKMESLSPREVKCFGDLDDSQASRIASELGQTAKAQLKEELKRELGHSNISTKDLMLQSKNYRIRKFTDSLSDSDRGEVIKIFRKALPAHKGVTGPVLPPNMFIREIGYLPRRNLTRNLCADDSWKALAAKLGMDNTSIQYLDNRRIENPADEVLRYWEVKAFSTVGQLYDILVKIECPFIADLL